MRIRTSIVAVVASVVLPAAAWAVAQPRTVRAHLVSLSDFREISEDVYAPESFPSGERDALLKRVRGAEARVSDLFGSYSARPTIIVAPDEESARQYGSNLHATLHASPFGTFIALGPEGVPSIDVLAHELSHAEHFSRVGYLRWIATPTWFVEGIGMLVDERPEYSEQALSRNASSREVIASLRELSTPGRFRRGDVRSHYAASKYQVDRIRRRLGHAGFVGFLEGQELSRAFLDQLDRALEQQPAL